MPPVMEWKRPNWTSGETPITPSPPETENTGLGGTGVEGAQIAWCQQVVDRVRSGGKDTLITGEKNHSRGGETFSEKVDETTGDQVQW